MPVQVTPVTPAFGARVEGVDLSRPVDDHSFRQIVEAFGRYAVLVFPGQEITDAEQVAFTERFGPLEVSIRKDRDQHMADSRISDISNVDGSGRIVAAGEERDIYNKGNELWHSDSSFKPVPAYASLLSGREVVSDGGNTEFADMRAAWDALPAATRERIDDLVVEHSIQYSRKSMGYDQFTEAERAALPPVLQRMVRVHPATGRRSLYLGSHASHVIGWPEAEGRALIGELMAHATQPRFVFAHRWTQFDLVMWDNRCALHRARPYDYQRYRRVMHRTTVRGDGPTVPIERMHPTAQRQAREMLEAA